MPTSFRLSDPAQTAASLDGALPAEGGLVLFEGVPEAEAVAAADALASRRGLRLNRVDASALVSGDLLASRGNLREVFDELRDPAVLVLTRAEALLAPPPPADDDPDARPPAEQLGLYLFDRIEAFNGIVALCTSGTTPGLGGARQRAVVVTA